MPWPGLKIVHHGTIGWTVLCVVTHLIMCLYSDYSCRGLNTGWRELELELEMLWWIWWMLCFSPSTSGGKPSWITDQVASCLKGTNGTNWAVVIVLIFAPLIQYYVECFDASHGFILKNLRRTCRLHACCALLCLWHYVTVTLQPCYHNLCITVITYNILGKGHYVTAQKNWPSFIFIAIYNVCSNQLWSV